MARQDLLDQGRPRARHADDENRQRRGVAETGAFGHDFGAEQVARHREALQRRRLVIIDLSAFSRVAVDLVIETGNPADSERFLPILDRHIAHCGTPPRQMAADGSYASRDNLDRAKARGVSDVAFHKKRGLAVADMAKSAWVYRRLRNFRAGIEAGISCFKRAYGGGRCTWRGLDHFKAYVWSAVVAHNLVLFARLKPG